MKNNMNTFTAFYCKDTDYGVMDKLYPFNNFSDRFIPFMTISAKDLGDAFMNLQGEVISPNGELRQAVLDLGLSHTSFSVGDVLYWHERDLYYMCQPLGWTCMALAYT
ncbi:MAG TPA: hypothetical protein DGG95_03195 [Cytophagales bacterium]|nr:hypothetical protein [Cytophagales bacterium]